MRRDGFNKEKLQSELFRDASCRTINFIHPLSIKIYASINTLIESKKCDSLSLFSWFDSFLLTSEKEKTSMDL